VPQDLLAVRLVDEQSAAGTQGAGISPDESGILRL
jgi:hypothetical protein